MLPLDGVRVVDVSGPIGAYATKLLADLGADVILVEPPSGHDLRRLPPFRDGVDGPEASLSFAYYHANKRGITLDASNPAARPLLDRLGDRADVVVMSPSRRRPLTGFGEDELAVAWASPDSVVCSITPFGLTGPYRHLRATHLVSYALSGSMHPMGPPEGPPLVVPGQLHFDLAAVHAAVSVVAALRVRGDVGGQLIDISAQEVEAFRDFFFERWAVAGATPQPRTASVGYPPTGTWQCRDGPFDVAAHQAHHWEAFLSMLDHPDELSEPALADPSVRREIFDGLRDVIEKLMAGHRREELFAKGQAAGLPTCVLNTPAEFVQDIQLAERGFFIEMTKPGTGTFTAPGPAVRTTPSLFDVRRPAPTLGQHNDEIYVGELGLAPDELARWGDEGVV